MDLGIVILNYLNYEDTIECVNSVLLQSVQPKCIVIVDNNSKNNSYDILTRKYEKHENIKIIKLKSNLGFARGNNAGIQVCRKMGLQNIFVINNDTILSETEFIRKLTTLKYNTDTGIIGPKIIGSDGLNQNPVYTENRLSQMVRRLIYSLFSEFKFYKFLKNSTRKQVTSDYKETDEVNQKFILHGSALYFTENFFKRYDGFYPETFLYVEENILDFMLEKTNLKFLYTDKICMYHKEDRSSAMAFNNNNVVYKKFMAASSFIAIKVYYSSYRKISNKIRTDMEKISSNFI